MGQYEYRRAQLDLRNKVYQRSQCDARISDMTRCAYFGLLACRCDHHVIGPCRVITQGLRGLCRLNHRNAHVGLTVIISEDWEVCTEFHGFLLEA